MGYEIPSDLEQHDKIVGALESLGQVDRQFTSFLQFADSFKTVGFRAFPLLRFFAPVTPGFLLPALVPLYVAWFFYMLRFYLMPWLLGYTVMGMLSFPLESEIAGLIYRILSPQ